MIGLWKTLAQQLLQGQRRVLGLVGVGAVAGVEVGVPGMAGAVAHQEPGRPRTSMAMAAAGHEPDDVPVGEAGQQHRRRWWWPGSSRSEIMMPKMPPKMPRSRTWNQVLLTLTTERAPKLWKYMFRLQSQLMFQRTWAGPAVEEHQADDQVQRRRPQRADQDRLAPADAVGQRAVEA